MNKFQKNIGSTDKMIRIIMGLIVLAVGYYYQNMWGLIGIIPIITATCNFCPLYTLFKINTCPMEKEQKSGTPPPTPPPSNPTGGTM